MTIKDELTDTHSPQRTPRETSAAPQCQSVRRVLSAMSGERHS